MGWAWLARGRASNKAARLPYLGRRRQGGPLGSRVAPVGDALAPGTLARALGRGEPPPPPANSAPVGQWAPSPASGRGGTKRKRGPARARRPESKGGGEERNPEDGGGHRQPAGRLPRPSNSLPSAPPPRQGREREASSLSSPARRKRGSAHKEQPVPHPLPAPGTARRALRPPTPAQPESLRGQGPRGASLSPTHPQLRAPAVVDPGRLEPPGCPAVRPSVGSAVSLPDLHWRARGSATQPPKGAATAGFPVKVRKTRLEEPPPTPCPRLPEPAGRGPGPRKAGRGEEGRGRDTGIWAGPVLARQASRLRSYWRVYHSHNSSFPPSLCFPYLRARTVPPPPEPLECLSPKRKGEKEKSPTRPSLPRVTLNEAALYCHLAPPWEKPRQGNISNPWV